MLFTGELVDHLFLGCRKSVANRHMLSWDVALVALYGYRRACHAALLSLGLLQDGVARGVGKLLPVPRSMAGVQVVVIDDGHVARVTWDLGSGPRSREGLGQKIGGRSHALRNMRLLVVTHMASVARHLLRAC